MARDRDIVARFGEGAKDLKGLDAGDGAVAHRVFSALLCGAFGDALVLGGELRGFLHFYEHHLLIFTPDGARAGFVAFGGERQRGTVSFQLTGGACAHVAAWASAAAVLSEFCTLKRVDVAFDDLDGVHGLDEARALYAAGAFTTNGRPPAYQEQGWDDGSGVTVYVGKDRAHQQLCVYEKGREQGARDGDEGVSWVRWEARFGAAYRVLPWDLLLHPAEFMRGQYPCLAFVADGARKVAAYIGKAASNFARALRHARTQCGRFLFAAHSFMGDDFERFVSKDLMVSRLPEWFRLNPLAGPVAATVCGIA